MDERVRRGEEKEGEGRGECGVRGELDFFLRDKRKEYGRGHGSLPCARQAC